MRMVSAHAEVVKSSHNLETAQAQITMTPEMFSLLSSGVYTYKELAVIRELCCNGIDAQIEAGNGDRPLRVHLPTRFEPYFEVRDFGTGLSHELVMKLYLNYGMSTKNDSNDFIGQMGIGSKSPFAIAQSFTVSSYVDGVVTRYSVYLEQGIPQVTKLATKETDEENGLAVRVAVSADRIQRFQEEAVKAFDYFSVKPELNIAIGSELDRMNTIVEEKGRYAARQYKDRGYSSRYVIEFNIVMGNIAYPVDLNNTFGEEAKNMLPDYFRSSVDLVDIYMPIGSVAVAASREALQMNEPTKEAIKLAVKDIQERIIADILKDFEGFETLQEAADHYHKLREEARDFFLHLASRIEWKGQKLSEVEEQLLSCRRGPKFNADGTPVYMKDKEGNLILNTDKQPIQLIDELYPSIEYVKYNTLVRSTRSASTMHVNGAERFSIFGAMCLKNLKRYIFVVNDRTHKNGTKKTVGRNQILLGICKLRGSEEERFNSYEGAVYIFNSEQHLDDTIKLHKLDRSTMKIYKMSEHEEFYQPASRKKLGPVKVYKANYSKTQKCTHVQEVTEDFSTIEEPQYYIRAVNDEVVGDLFNASPNLVIDRLSLYLESNVYMFRKSNWKKIPEDWVEVTSEVLEEHLTPEKWIEMNRHVTNNTVARILDVTDCGVIAREFMFNNRIQRHGYAYDSQINSLCFLEGNEEALEKVFGRLAYFAAPVAYKYVYSGLYQLSHSLTLKSKFGKKVRNARGHMESHVKNYYKRRAEKEFLLHNVNWRVVTARDVSKFLGTELASVPKGTTVYV